MGVEVLILSFPYLCMKKIIFTLITLCCVACSDPKSTKWEIEKLEGTRDTIEARDYWIMSPDSQLIKFEINDSLKIIYNKDGVTGFRKIF